MVTDSTGGRTLTEIRNEHAQAALPSGRLNGPSHTIWMDEEMVLVLIEDLLFRSKISAAGKAAGVDVVVVKTPEDAMRRARDQRPALILLDLDGQRTRPLELVESLKRDPDLADVPTLGFVSHVHADIIQQARLAGIAEVMARGAFAAALHGVLGRVERHPDS